MDPLTPDNENSFQESVKPGAPASQYNSKIDITRQNENRPMLNLGLHNNPDMFVCPIEPFLAHYGPCDVPQATVDACMVRMSREGEGVLKCNNEGEYSWVDFNILLGNNVHEDETFQPLGKIVDSVLVDKINNLKFMLVPNIEIKSDIGGCTHTIDGCFIDGSYTGYSREIKAPVVIKKYRYKPIRALAHWQILGACHQVLNEDPRRMWIHGLTFENSMVSMWYFSRSHSVKSFAFNWIENPRILVHVLLVFARATPLQMGVDPTVHIGPPGKNGRSYVYEVPSEAGRPLFFKTCRSLVPERARISGQATRVWKVTQVTSADGKKEVNGKKVILKDVWLHEHSKTEAENMDAIFQAVDDFVEAGLNAEAQYEVKADPNTSPGTLLSDLATVTRLTMQFINRDPRFHAFDDATKKRLCDNLTNKKYRSMFLTKLHAWKGRTCRAVGSEAIRFRDLFSPMSINKEFAEELVEEKCKEQGGLHTEDAPVCTENIPDDYADEDQLNTVDDKSRHFAPRHRGRFIYEEVCTTLKNLETVGDVVDILCQTIDALHILFAAGWVHRDISCNNIMAFRSSRNQAWTLKLADLELSRPMIDKNWDPRFDPRIGTPFFMPVEILSREYLFEAYLLDPDEDEVRNLADNLDIDKSSRVYQSLSRFSKIPIDGINIPVNADWDKAPQSGQTVDHNFQHDLESVWWILLWIITCRVHYELSAKAVSRFFRHDINDFDGRSRAFEKAMHAVKRVLHSDLKGIGSLVECLRAEMHRDYIVRAIVGHLELPESYSNIHALFSTEFREIQAKQGPWKNMKLEHKRQAFEDEDESAVPPTVTDKCNRNASEAEPRDSTREKLKGEYWSFNSWKQQGETNITSGVVLISNVPLSARV
ncbi:hypothetical protein D9619_006198 [Psilocybe cf. subviscida]|uniref:Fungal-type protein kinase domain-containing protein n=1 Tax=Psilocybe cf. subviscida TaxID=2480587 RepID=A0A8H5B5T9_9AGAR|nr:hypothetical protein D9619_006198 [Psilocybe cf. subviscida]